MIVGILLTQLYSIRFILKALTGLSRAGVLISRHDQDPWTIVATGGLLLPALSGGIVLSRVLGPTFIRAVTPASLKALVRSAFILAPLVS